MFVTQVRRYIHAIQTNSINHAVILLLKTINIIISSYSVSNCVAKIDKMEVAIHTVCSRN